MKRTSDSQLIYRLFSIILLASVVLSSFSSIDTFPVYAQQAALETPSAEPQCFTLELIVASGEGTLEAQTPWSCAVGYLAGTLVELRAQAHEGYVLASWQNTNDDSTKNNANAVTINSDTTVMALFVPDFADSRESAAIPPDISSNKNVSQSGITALSATTIFSDTFSGSYPGSWYIGHDGGGGSYAWAWSTGQTYAHEYSNPAGGQYYYPNDLHVYMERRGISLSGYNTATLSFSKIVDTEANYDYFTVNVRDQAGVWHEVFRQSGENSTLAWSTQTLSLNSYAGQTNLYIQFRFDSDSSVSGSPYDGVYIDNVSLTAEMANTAPTLNLTAPASNITVTQGASVAIQWTDTDPDSNASISLARDTDSDPQNGSGHSWITISLTEDPDGTGDQYSWNTSGVTPGTYYIWGMIYDAVNPAVYDVAPGRVTIQPINVAPTLDLTVPASDLTVTQGASVAIQWTDTDPDNNASISLAYDTDNNPTNGGQTWITISLTEDPDGTGDQYSWNTSGITPGTYYIWGMIYDAANPAVYDVSPGRVTIQVLDSYEPDNTCAQAKTINSGSRQTRSIIPSGDDDWVKFTLSQMSNLTIQTSGPSGDTEMWLYSGDCTTQINYNDDGNGAFSLISQNRLPSGTYYILIREFGDNGSIITYYLDLTATISNPSDGIVTNYALLIGSGADSSNPDSYWENFVQNDVNKLQETLTTNGANWSPTRITKILNSSITKSGVEQAIQSIGSLMDNDDLFLFYYTGHGSAQGLYFYGQEEFTPSELKLAMFNYIPDGALKMVLLDSCFSGLFADYFSQNAVPNTSVISTSSATETTSWKHFIILGDRSMGTYHYTSALDGGGDSNNNRIVAAEEVFAYVQPRIVAGSLGSQHPQFYDPVSPNPFPIVSENYLYNTIPYIQLTAPSTTQQVTRGQTVPIQWDDSDYDTNATIALAYDLDQTSEPWLNETNHTWITVSVLEDPDGAGDQYSWNTTNVSPGTYTIWAMIYDTQHSPRFVRAPGIITINDTNPVPVLSSISPTSTTAGGVSFTLTANGSSFVNSSKVRWNGSDRTTTYISSTQLTASIPASDITSAGTASITVFNPAPGGGASNPLTFTIGAVPGAFNRISPTNGAINQSTSPTLTWSGSVNATSYEYCYDTTNDNACSNWTNNGTSTSIALNSLSQSTTYYWHVRAKNSFGITYANGSSTGYWSFATGGVPPPFNKTSPANGATNQPTSLTLSWGLSAGATSYEYCYDTTDDDTCSNWTSNGTATSKAINGLSLDTIYYWHVRANNSFGSTYSDGSVTRFWSFTTGSIPGGFNKSSPTNGATNQLTSLTLNWDSSANATSYEYCYDTTNDNSCSNWVNNGMSTNKSLNGLSQSATYYWHVRANNSFGTTYSNGSSTSFWSFTTGGVPGAFVKSSPANGAMNQFTDLTLTWGSSINAASYEYCYDTTNDNTCSNWTDNGTTASVRLYGLSQNTIYYWQVRAVNSFGTIYSNGSATSFWLFRTGSLPGAFNKTSPTNASLNRPLSLTLSWSVSANATSYEYCYDTTDDNACLDWTNNGTSTSKTISGLNVGTTYYWQVRALNSFGSTYSNGSESALWSFTTSPVQLKEVRTVDGSWSTKNAFQPGDPIQWVIDVENTTAADISVNLVYDVKNPAGQLIQHSTPTVSVPAGISSVGISGTTSNIVGTYTITGSVSYQGITTSKSVTYTVQTFVDIPTSHPFWRYIEAFYNAGITTGCSQSPKLYCPDNLVTRAEMAVFIERAKGNFAPNPNPSGMFADMPYLTFTPFIEQFYNDGITTGCSSNPLMYCPTNNVNRAEMATFIERAIGHFNPQPNPSGMFSDVPSPGLEGLTKFIEQFYNDGITTGCQPSPLLYCPTNSVTRAEMAVFIVRAFHIPLP